MTARRGVLKYIDVGTMASYMKKKLYTVIRAQRSQNSCLQNETKASFAMDECNKEICYL